MGRIALTLTFIAAFPLLLLIRSADASAANASVERRMMIYGDSLSAGYGIDPKQGWATLLQSELKKDGVTVVNSSISGETTRGGLNRIKADLLRIKPDIMVLALGANDGLRGLPVAQTRNNLQAIIDEARRAKARVVLIGIQIPPNYGIDFARQFRDLYVDLANSNRLPPPPFLLEGFAEKLEMFQPDRLHPTAGAQPAMLKNVLPVILKVVKESRSTVALAVPAKK